MAGNAYTQYQFTTPANANPRLYFARAGMGSYPGQNFHYGVRVSTDPNFSSYWTIVPNATVQNGTGGYQYVPGNTSRFPLLTPSTTYYLRVYPFNGPANSSGSGSTLTIDDFQFGTGICPLPTVTVTKISNGGTGTFNFTGSNGFAAQSIITTTAGTGMAGSTQVLAATNTATTVTEAAPAGFTLTAINCTGLPSGTPTYTVNGVNGGNVVLPAAAMTTTATIACTFTNTRRVADLSITKTNTPTVGALDQANDTVDSGQTTTYTLVVTNDGTTAVTGAVVRDAPGAGITCPAGNAVTISGDGVPAGSFTVADLTGANGIVLGALAAGQSATLSFNCQVN
ncbi:conserved repeat domain protein [Lysobacter gummosus]|nr:conserved repeat domain protein [Lysobacter gummosus]